MTVGNRANSRRPSFFTRTELQQLLALYSQRVADGTWRDYAIDRRGHVVVFSVFRHAGEHPVYAVVKNTRNGTFELYHGRQRVKRAGSLAETVTDLQRRSAIRAVF